MYQGEGFLVVTGDVGAGKTTLVRALLEHLDPSTIVAAQIVSTQLQADDLLRAVAKAFGIMPQSDDKATLIASIEVFLLKIFQHTKRALLVIDEAQNLNAGSIEELRMLSNFQHGNRALLQSFLVGQPELRALMRSPSMEQFRQRVIASYHLGPLDEVETRGYIEHRLRHVGWQGAPEFDGGAIHAIFAATSGIPRRINAIANRLMLAGCITGQRTFSGADVEEVVSEFTDEIGTSAAAAPLQDSASVKRVAKADTTSTRRRLVKLSERIDSLEQDMTDLIELVRLLIDPDRARPDPVGLDRLGRLRKMERRA